MSKRTIMLLAAGVGIWWVLSRSSKKKYVYEGVTPPTTTTTPNVGGIASGWGGF